MNGFDTSDTEQDRVKIQRPVLIEAMYTTCRAPHCCFVYTVREVNEGTDSVRALPGRGKDMFLLLSLFAPFSFSYISLWTLPVASAQYTVFWNE